MNDIPRCAIEFAGDPCSGRRWPFRSHRFEAAYDKTALDANIEVKAVRSIRAFEAFLDAGRTITYRGSICRYCGETRTP